jgi:uncharacterized protein
LTVRAEPVRVEERIESLDVIRGFALFGILCMNLLTWFRTTPVRYQIEHHPFPGLANRIVEVLVDVLVDGKFFSLFSLLFGVGLAIQMERAEARGARFRSLALRRLGLLFVFGAAHVTLLWLGDILHIYALSGLVLLIFLRRKPRTVHIAFLVLYLLPVVIGAGISLVQSLRHAPPPPGPSSEELAALQTQVDEAVRIYGKGSYLEILRFRLVDYTRSFLDIFLIGFFGSLTMFLLGLIVWRRGILRRPEEHTALLRKTIALGVPFAVLPRLVRFIPREMWIEYGVFWFRPFHGGLVIAGTAGLALAYAAAILLLLQRPSARAVLSPLSALGRMALTNYLLQSLLCSTVFYGYGFGLYDRLGPAAAVPIVVAIHALQIPFSLLWLRRYRFGPVEWLWRSLTYGTAQPMRR